MTQIPTIDDCMATRLVTFKPADNIHTAVRSLLDNGFSGAPVVDEAGRLVGVLSKKDCLKIAYQSSYHQDWSGTVAEFMSPDPETIESGTDIVQAADRFVRSRYRRFPVVRHGALIGQVSRADILKAIYQTSG